MATSTQLYKWKLLCDTIWRELVGTDEKSIGTRRENKHDGRIDGWNNVEVDEEKNLLIDNETTTRVRSAGASIKFFGDFSRVLSRSPNRPRSLRQITDLSRSRRAGAPFFMPLVIFPKSSLSLGRFFSLSSSPRGVVRRTWTDYWMSSGARKRDPRTCTREPRFDSPRKTSLSSNWIKNIQIFVKFLNKKNYFAYYPKIFISRNYLEHLLLFFF